MRKETINALIEVIESLRSYAYTRGEGPFFEEDREESEEALDKAMEKFKIEIRLEEKIHEI